MEKQRRGADGRRLFSAEFKREQIARVVRKELTFAELSRELGIRPVRGAALATFGRGWESDGGGSERGRRAGE